MSGDTLDDILKDDDDLEPKEPQVEPEPQAEPEPSPEPPAEPQAEPAAEPPVSEREAGLQAALTESRNSNREMREQMAALQAQVTQLSQPQPAPPEPPKLPDPLENPDNFNNALTDVLDQRDRRLIAEISQSNAHRAYGEEKVEQALQASRMQGVTQQFLNSRDPYGDIVRWHDQQTEMQAIREAGGLDAFKEKIRADALAEAQAQQVADTIVPPQPSLAAQPSLGRQPAVLNPADDDTLKDILGNPHDV